MTVCKCSWLYFYSITYFNDMYAFNIYIVSILGDLSCMESLILLQIILMAYLFLFLLLLYFEKEIYSFSLPCVMIGTVAH